MKQEILDILKRYNSNRARLLDILWDIHNIYGYIPDEALPTLSEALNMSKIDISETVSFYHFFHDKPSGKYRIYLADTVIAKMSGFQEVLETLEQETKCPFGDTDVSGTFGLYETSCIGLSDQEPAMLIDKVVFNNLTPKKVTNIITQIKAGKTPLEISTPKAIKTKDVAYIDNLVQTTIYKSGPVFFKSNTNYKSLLSKCLDFHPLEIIDNISESNIKGRGGAGFPTGLKWQLCREADGEQKYVICNADEGEPGTFKDRILLTRSPKDVLVGMIIGGYSIGSDTGIIYLRSEYWYIKEYLENQIQELKNESLLGENILGSSFSFNIRIQMGAGSYVCGDETALLESCEGKRGTPRVKPPYPIQNGYLGKPTIINNVETFAAITRISEKGGKWYGAMGTKDSTGTRLLSVSGDCERPGIYEIEWGITLGEVLKMVGAKNAKAVQVSGPSGECVSAKLAENRIICYSDLSCNGSFMIFDETRDILDIVESFMHFFVEESCGICIPCRVGNVDLHNMMKRIRARKATQKDLDDIVSWSKIIKSTSRCGLGTTSPKPILTTLDQFPEIYKEKIVVQKGSLLPSFDMDKALLDHDNAHKELSNKNATNE
ncbi:NAD(P)H-dependent oxidoreductase subunit E [Lutibacter sp.]|uniref:NAD(P)H-dependent oxidoreductase subunit E n=1 Tax=Lutibacter sp. TaxID=1925666 RepID=UPI0025C31039|nr:NAD(P)H-dependent oxidoreductase subunit E [Lutibacter sp.]MCF6167128.1 NAD(P)H-dependent oxidoreductase subunit E [Lutibacter sp.]